MRFFAVLNHACSFAVRGYPRNRDSQKWAFLQGLVIFQNSVSKHFRQWSPCSSTSSISIQHFQSLFAHPRCWRGMEIYFPYRFPSTEIYSSFCALLWGWSVRSVGDLAATSMVLIPTRLFGYFRTFKKKDLDSHKRTTLEKTSKAAITCNSSSIWLEYSNEASFPSMSASKTCLKTNRWVFHV